jgi:hypothetical protein
MTLQEFINKNKGKKLDFDGAYQNQCMDLYRYYLKDVWGLPQTPKVKGAFQVFNSLPASYEKFTSGVPEVGDVITWNEKFVKNGHIAVVVSANNKTFDAFQQNAPKTGDACNTARYTYKNIIGWFRPKNMIQTTYMQVTVLANRNNFKTWPQQLQELQNMFKTYSGGKLEIVPDLVKTDLLPIPLKDFMEVKKR